LEGDQKGKQRTNQGRHQLDCGFNKGNPTPKSKDRGDKSASGVWNEKKGRGFCHGTESRKLGGDQWWSKIVENRHH